MAQPGAEHGTPASLVPGDVHARYRSERLLHEAPDELVSGAVTLRALRPHATRSIFFLVAFVANWALALLFSVASFASLAATAPSDLEPAATGTTVFAILSYAFALGDLVVMVLWIVALVVPAREPIAEYGLLVEGHSHAAPAAYWWVAETMRQRRAPFGVAHGRAGGTPVMAVANGRLRGVVVIQAAGTDLYLGWSMWRSRSTAMMAVHLLRDLLQAVGQHRHAGDVRAAYTRALRELLHSVVREGVQRALVEPPPSGDGGSDGGAPPDTRPESPGRPAPDQAGPRRPAPRPRTAPRESAATQDRAATKPDT